MILNYFVDDQQKNMISQLNLSEVSLSELRINAKKYYIELSERYTCYDNIKEQFKRY